MQKCVGYFLGIPESSRPVEAAIVDYAKTQGLELVSVFSDPEYKSASLNREGLFDAFVKLRENASNTIIVQKLSDLAAGQRNLNYLNRVAIAPGRLRLIALEDQIDTETDDGKSKYVSIMDVAQESRFGLRLDSTEVSATVTYLDILKKCHQELTPELYVEIGVKYGVSLNLASGAAIGVDPAPRVRKPPANAKIYAETSDAFFASNKLNKIIAPGTIEFSFIDGMHAFDFVLRDFMNVERLSNSKTVVAIDDVCPRSALEAHPTQLVLDWAGDVWKLVLCLRRYRPDLEVLVINASPTGIALIGNLDSSSTVLEENYLEILEYYKHVDYWDIGDFRDLAMGVVDADHPYVDGFIKKKANKPS